MLYEQLYKSEAEGLHVQGQPGQFSKLLSQKVRKGWDYGSVLEYCLAACVEPYVLGAIFFFKYL